MQIRCSTSAFGAGRIAPAELLELASETMASKASSVGQTGSLLHTKSTTLANGLRVIVITDHAVPRVSVGVLYNVGSADDPEDLIGLSHMTEHMFFHGSERFPDSGITLGNLGGSINACTSEDFTLYVTDAPSSALSTIFDVEADRMGNFHLTNNEIFLKEKMAVFEERLMCVENPPLGLAEEYIQNALSPQHPYGKEIIGSRGNIENYTLNAVNEHYRRWYKPNNAILIVIGDAEASEVFELAEQYFGSIPKGAIPERKRPMNALKDNVHHTVTYYNDKVATPKIDFLYNVPHHSVEGIAAEVALKIGLEALFGGTVFAFQRYFEDEKALVSSMEVDIEDTFDPFPVTLSVQLMPGVTVEKFQKIFKKKLKTLLEKGLPKEEFERAKRGFSIDALYRSQNGQQKMRILLSKLAMGYTLEQIEALPQSLDETSYEQVMGVLRTVFSVEPFGTVLYLPKI